VLFLVAQSSKISRTCTEAARWALQRMSRTRPPRASLRFRPHLVLAPAHCRADTSYYRTDSAPIRLSADRAADSETYRLDIASTGACHRGDMIFSKKHCRADNYCHCRPDSMAKIKTCRPDISSAGTHYRADNAPSDHHYRPTNFPDIMMDSVQMSGR
jgi:hypothetical protein